MGFEAQSIGRSFLIEGGFIAAQSLFVGAGLGSIMVMALSHGQAIKKAVGYYPAVPMPTPAVAVLCAALFIAAVAASAAPARSAAKIPPAIALRLVD